MDTNRSGAYLDGWLAHMKDVDVEDNPYDDKRQARSHAQWTSGWCARFGAIKHGHALPYDEAEFQD